MRVRRNLGGIWEEFGRGYEIGNWKQKWRVERKVEIRDKGGMCHYSFKMSDFLTIQLYT